MKKQEEAPDAELLQLEAELRALAARDRAEVRLSPAGTEALEKGVAAGFAAGAAAAYRRRLFWRGAALLVACVGGVLLADLWLADREETPVAYAQSQAERESAHVAVAESSVPPADEPAPMLCNNLPEVEEEAEESAEEDCLPQPAPEVAVARACYLVQEAAPSVSHVACARKASARAVWGVGKQAASVQPAALVSSPRELPTTPHALLQYFFRHLKPQPR
ncbi:MAG: hypothetical protein PUD60_05715 [Akkermansia muciniphila]|nr:hypothetical protein [Akkermansia muciniphila]